MSLIAAFGRWRPVDFCEFAASLVYRVRSSIVKTTHKNAVLINTNSSFNYVSVCVCV